MRTMIAAMTLALTLGLGNSANAMPGQGASNGGMAIDASLLQRAQYSHSRYCERLRRACTYKEERGEVGEGNCRRYRAECRVRLSYCGELRRACLYKEERGQVGDGNCRRYRHECGGRLY